MSDTKALVITPFTDKDTKRAYNVGEHIIRGATRIAFLEKKGLVIEIKEKTNVLPSKPKK